MTKSPNDLAASVRARLLNRARATQQDFNLVLTRYVIERLLYRISISNYADQFMLKGALLFDLWFDIPHRPTRDIDFLGFGSAELPHIEKLFQVICDVKAEDGVTFHADTVRAVEIRKEANYSGVRVTLLGVIDGARSQVQVDIGFGDAVTPAPERVAYPVMLSDFARPQLYVYPRYTVVAEKLEALSTLGIANSRMKDYFDLWVLACHAEFEGKILKQAVQATFNSRKSVLKAQAPFGLTEAFAQDPQKQIQWQAFLRKNRLNALTLNETVAVLANFLVPVIEAASTDKEYLFLWRFGGPWQTMPSENRFLIQN